MKIVRSRHFSADWLVALALAMTLGGAAPAADEQPPVEIAYYALKPSFVSNLSGGPDYIRCDVQLKTDQASELPKVELHEAALRHAILMLITGEDGKQLRGREGKERLRKKALAAVQAQLEALAGSPIVSDLYFTNYYVQ